MHGAGDRGGDNTRANGCSARRTLIPMLLASPRNLIGTLQGWIRCAANGDVSNAGYSVLLRCNTCCVGVTMYAKDDPNVSGITKNGAGYPVPLDVPIREYASQFTWDQQCGGYRSQLLRL